MNIPPLSAVNSTNIVGAGFVASNYGVGDLFLKFATGGTYHFRRCPESIYAGIMGPNPWRFYVEHVMLGHQGERVRYEHYGDLKGVSA